MGKHRHNHQPTGNVKRSGTRGMVLVEYSCDCGDTTWKEETEY